jgi:hypothetical protein
VWEGKDPGSIKVLLASPAGSSVFSNPREVVDGGEDEGDKIGRTDSVEGT